jgi:hypothetical protein
LGYGATGMVDELMCAAWGRRYTHQDTEDYIERSTQMLAKTGNPDSSVSSMLTSRSNQALYKCRAMCPSLRSWSCRLRKHERT